ncbi:unnamed protein product [Polarella glacialis]|uniref:Methyltransferase FkbM domain-containing protein n=2 Tax=Polarella glacialis TaxID=89957 RepID=A0A813FXJ3_POLGL|nr:unnamed protein product [Polarella glacialis]
MESALGQKGPPSWAAARYFLRRLRHDFAGSAGAVEPFLRSVLLRALQSHAADSGSGQSPGQQLFSCWDVGAAPFDDQFLLRGSQEVWQLCLELGSRRVRAFEPSAKGHARLLAAASEMPSGHVSSLQVDRMALSSAPGESHLNRGGQSTGSIGHKGCGLWMNDAECTDPSTWEAVPVSTVDLLLGPDQQIDVLKIDVEGLEWEVLQGAQSALTTGRIGLLILEYGDKWSPQIALSCKHFHSAFHSNPSDWPQEPTLRGVTRFLGSLGYDGYFIGTQTPVPISGDMWHDVYEVCRAPHRICYHGVGQICWLDVAFVHRSHPLARAVSEGVRWQSFDSG